jgi:Cof subfamily protein (haloacid dehalogenase superfamily)
MARAVGDYELFAFDLDGTLLSPDCHLPEEVAAFVQGLSRSARVTLATGRSLASVQPYVGPLGVNAPAILYHGAVVWDFRAGRALLERRIPPKAALSALRALERFEVDIQLYRSASDPTIYVRAMSEAVEEFARMESLPLAVADLEQLARDRPLKILIIGEPKLFPEISFALSQASPELTVVRAARRFLEVLPPGVDKGRALEWLCRSLGIPLQRVVAVGDQESDLGMIGRAGLGVAMAAAPAVVRERADLVVASVTELSRLLSPGNGGAGEDVKSGSRSG